MATFLERAAQSAHRMFCFSVSISYYRRCDGHFARAWKVDTVN